VDSAVDELAFFDDFASGELDRTKWNVRTTGPVFNDEQQAYVDLPDTVYVAESDTGDGGRHLVLQPRYRPGFTTPDGRRFDFVSGRIDTRDRFQFCCGWAAARIKLPAGRGVWPAFWALGRGQWPDGGEIDVMEHVGEADWVSAAVHGPGYSGETGLVNQLHFADSEDAVGWHVYSVDWSPVEIAFCVDGRVNFRVTRQMVDFRGTWAFDNEMYLVLNVAIGGTYPFKTNGVRSPYYGVAAETVDAIRDDRVNMLVDWVCVARRALDGAGSHFHSVTGQNT
jgi:beta-glucanase (GH16 family)